MNCLFRINENGAPVSTKTVELFDLKVNEPINDEKFAVEFPRDFSVLEQRPEKLAFLLNQAGAQDVKKQPAKELGASVIKGKDLGDSTSASLPVSKPKAVGAAVKHSEITLCALVIAAAIVVALAVLRRRRRVNHNLPK